MSNEDPRRDSAQKRVGRVLAALPGFLLKGAWGPDDLPAPPEADRDPLRLRPSWTQWLVERDHLPEPPPAPTQPRTPRVSFLGWLLSREELPEARENGRRAAKLAGPRDSLPEPAESHPGGPGLLGWIVAAERLPQREPRAPKHAETSTWRRLAGVTTAALVLGAVLLIAFVAAQPVRRGQSGIAFVYTALMLAVSYGGGWVTASWILPPALGRKLAVFYVGFGILWLNLHLLLIYANRPGGILLLLAHVVIGNGIAALAAAALERVTRP